MGKPAYSKYPHLKHDAGQLPIQQYRLIAMMIVSDKTPVRDEHGTTSQVKTCQVWGNENTLCNSYFMKGVRLLTQATSRK